MRLDYEAVVRDDVTLVELRLENDSAERRRVRVANELDGDVLFPRSRGMPAAGWDAGGYEGVLDPGEVRALGYACPAVPVTPPAAIAWSERAADACDPATAAGVVREFGDPRPPRRAIAAPPAALPEPVAAWLDRVADRIGDGSAGALERRQLSAVATRIAGVRREPSEHGQAAPRGQEEK